jgi:hypothetical protein
MLLSRPRLARLSHRPLAVFLPALLALTACDKKTATAPAPAAAAPATTAPIAASPAGAPVAIKPVLGRWQRTDGDYTLAIIGGENGGILQAQYFNPKSINVSRAAWIDSGGRLQVLVELNDVGYPGATYVLHLDTTTDRLVGQYKQPAQQQTYDIEFTRQAPSPLK